MGGLNMIGFIGCGNMATAIIKGIIKSGAFSANEINAFDVFAPSAQKLKDDYNINILESETDVVKNSDTVILAVKPNVIATVLQKINFELENKDVLLISIAAGKTIEFIRSNLTHHNAIVRVMPNINAVVGEAMCAYTANENVTSSQIETTEKICNSIGKVIKLDENYFPLFGVIAGCGPAFAYMFIDAMARAGVKNGMSKDTALMISAQTVLGSAKMIMETAEHPWQLIDKVCSPNGTTIEGVTSLQADGFEKAVHNAVQKAIDKDSKL
jgi:pyrroline-5-carboxylate reductase